MKKTLAVNLGGTVFQIDEDAYNLLDNYLNNLRFHFRKEEGGEEIVRDMEMRISELFLESKEGGQLVITIDNVEAVIARMGRPEQLDDENVTDDVSDGQSHASNTAGESSGTNTTNGGEDAAKTGDRRNFEAYRENTSDEVKKRLFRDVDHHILGGVLSGIAAYFGWDPTVLRIVWIVLGILPGGPSVFIIYLVLFFIIPPARTATEKLQMRGEPINMENIGKTVTHGFEREKNSENAQGTRTGLQKFFDIVISIVGILVKIFIVFLTICCVPFLFVGLIVLFSLVMSAFGVIIHLPSICWELMPSIPWNNMMDSPISGIFFLLNSLLVIGIPLLVIAQIILQHFGYCKSMNTWAKLFLVVMWFIALIICFILFFTISTL